MNDKVVDTVFLALADPTRRALLTRLSAGESCISDLAKPFKMSLNAISKHVRVLERARLVRRRRVWREYRVRIDPSQLNEISDWLASHRTLWTQRLEVLDVLLTDEDDNSAQTSGNKEVEK